MVHRGIPLKAMYHRMLNRRRYDRYIHTGSCRHSYMTSGTRASGGTNGVNKRRGRCVLTEASRCVAREPARQSLVHLLLRGRVRGHEHFERIHHTSTSTPRDHIENTYGHTDTRRPHRAAALTDVICTSAGAVTLLPPEEAAAEPHFPGSSGSGGRWQTSAPSHS